MDSEEKFQQANQVTDDSDPDDIGLVIDLEQQADVSKVQNKKIENVFDRHSDVTSSSVSPKSTPLVKVGPIQGSEKGDARENNDGDLECRPESLEHCLAITERKVEEDSSKSNNEVTQKDITQNDYKIDSNTPNNAVSEEESVQASSPNKNKNIYQKMDTSALNTLSSEKLSAKQNGEEEEMHMIEHSASTSKKLSAKQNGEEEEMHMIEHSASGSNDIVVESRSGANGNKMAKDEIDGNSSVCSGQESNNYKVAGSSDDKQLKRMDAVDRDDKLRQDETEDTAVIQNDDIQDKNNMPLSEEKIILSENVISFVQKKIQEIDEIKVPLYDETSNPKERKDLSSSETGDSVRKVFSATTNGGDRVVYNYVGQKRNSDDKNLKSLCKQCEKGNCECCLKAQEENSDAKIFKANVPVASEKIAQAKKNVNIGSSSWSSLGVQRCENCKFTTSDASLFPSHSAICSKKPVKAEISLLYSNGKFNCQTCEYPTSLRKKFEEHIALHLMAQPYICITCDITFESKKEIEIHVKMKHASDTVKCGLKGSKRIGQILEILVVNGKHKFIGRAICRKVQSQQELKVITTSCTLQTSTSPLNTVNISTVKNSSKESDVLFVSSSTVASTACTPSKAIHKPNEPTVHSRPVPQTISTQGPLILVPVNNVNGNFLIPFSNIPTPTNVINPGSTSVTAALPGPSVTTVASANNQFINVAPIRFASQTITIQGGSIQTNSLPQNVAVQVNSASVNVPTNSQNIQNNQPRYVILPRPITSVIPGATSVFNHHSNANIPKLVTLNTVDSSPRTFVSILSPTSIRPTIVQSQTPMPLSLASARVDSSLSGATGISLTEVGKSNKENTGTASTVSEVINLASVMSPGVETKGNKLFFRKFGDLYMCDLCKSETPLENSFKEHIWKHFHQMQNICKECPPEYNAATPCKIVLQVMVGLLSSSLGQPALTVQNNPTNPLTKDVVTISDDEDDGTNIAECKDDNKTVKTTKSNDTMTENDHGNVDKLSTVDVMKNTSEILNEPGLQLKITNTFSLSDSSKTENNNITVSKQNGSEYDTGSNVEQTNEKHLSSELDSIYDKSSLNNTVTSASISFLTDKRPNNVVDSDLKETTQVKPSESLNCSTQNKTKRSNEVNKNTFNDHLTSLVSTTAQCVFGRGKEQRTSDNNKECCSDAQAQHIIFNKNSVVEMEATIDKNQELSNILSEFESNNLEKQPNLLASSEVLNKMVDEERANTSSPDVDRKPIAFPLVAFYKCGFDGCTFSASTSNEFREHLNQSHDNALEYKCAHCGQKSFTEDSHIRHLLFHSKPQNSLLFQCGVIGCRFRANLLHVYKEHLEQVHQNVLLHRCHSCKDCFPSVASLTEHLQNNLLKFVQCPFCTMKDGVRRNVLNHITTHHPGKPRQINVTSQLICQERETNEYERMKLKLNPQSGVSGDNQSNVTIRQNDIEAKASSVQTVNDVVENDPEDAEILKKITSNSSIINATYYRCPTCTYLGVGQTKLSKHLEMHSSNYVQHGPRPFICPECPQCVNSIQQFISHLNLHIGEHLCYVYVCQHCGFGTNMSNKIQHHVSESHGSNDVGKDYLQRTIKFSVNVTCCAKCNAAFKTPQAHRDHVLKCHGITTNESSGKDDLESPVIAKTPQVERNESCIVSPDNEDEFNPRRFTCNECGWATKKLPYLKSHLKKHNPNQDRRQITLFKCNFCEYTSTSKLIISKHSQNKHPGKPVRVKRVIETVYITDSPEDGMSIDKFHCDLCSYSCEKISGLQSHLSACHAGKSVSDVAKTKDVYSGPKEDFLIPSGTVFKDFIQCSLCAFKTKKRIELLRHIKNHPSLVPKTQSPSPKDTLYYDKVQNPLFDMYKSGGKRKNSTDGYHAAKKPRPSSPTISYDRIMMDTAKRDTGFRKQVATKSTTSRGSDGVKSMLYYLGGEQLHMKLRPCISEFRETPHYTCLICSDVFDEKYTLHKHILQHMKVYFYKCAYCDHGTLDQTMVMVHIQRTHRRAIQYSKLDVEEIDSHINKAIHDMKSQVGSGKEKIVFDEMPRNTKSEEVQPSTTDKSKHQKIMVTDAEKKEEPFTKKIETVVKETKNDMVKETKNVKSNAVEVKPLPNQHKIVKEVNEMPSVTIKKELQSPERKPAGQLSHTDKSFKENDSGQHEQKSENCSNIESKPDVANNENDEYLHPRVRKDGNIFKCTICEHQSQQRYKANNHVMTHSKVRRYMCSVCQFNYVSRWPGDIKKHIDTKHHKTENAQCLWNDLTPCDITLDGKPFNDMTSSQPMFLSVYKATKVEGSESDISDIKLKSPSKRDPRINVGKPTRPIIKIDGRSFKSVFKCLVCEKTFKSRNAINEHFRHGCKGALYGCPSCKFKNTDDNQVRKHMKVKHDDESKEPVVLSRNQKIRLYKVPPQKDTVRQSIKSTEEVGKTYGTVSFKCLACKRTFKNRNAGMYHAISALCNKTIKGCSICDFKDVSDSKAELHVKSHKDKKGKVIELPKEAKIEMIETQTKDESIKLWWNKVFCKRGQGLHL